MSIVAGVTILGEDVVPGEDYVAFFDSDGYVIGAVTMTATGFDPNCGATRGFNVSVSSNENTVGCEAFPGYGATNPIPSSGIIGEMIRAEVYDGSTGLFFELPVTVEFDAPGFVILNGNPCSPIVVTAENVLPSTITGIWGRAVGSKTARLDWEVAREENVAHYEVQRSYDGREWTVLDEVVAAGDSEELLQYSYLDEGLTSPTIYYRLRTVDRDGADELSGIVIVQLENFGDRAVAVYPNPASVTDLLGIQLNGTWSEDTPITAELIDISGRKVARFNGLTTGTSSFSLPAGLAPGMYALRVVQADHHYTEKVVLR